MLCRSREACLHNIQFYGFGLSQESGRCMPNATQHSLKRSWQRYNYILRPKYIHRDEQKRGKCPADTLCSPALVPLKFLSQDTRQSPSRLASGDFPFCLTPHQWAGLLKISTLCIGGVAADTTTATSNCTARRHHSADAAGAR